MKIVKTVSDLKSSLDSYRSSGAQIGLVPTMGALHDGHASLIKRSVIENDVTVVSIFVNPTQFNDKNDLENYPHTLEADCQLLDNLGVQLVFAPSVEEIYPVPDQRTFSFPPVDEVMEGKFRPGHFNGVCQIVSKLFQIVEPDNAYFGEKDFQQIAVIRAMVKSLAMKVNIVSCPIVRESDGLALSSRNTLLKPDERAIAVNISKYLFESVEYSQSHTLQETRSFVIDHINTVSGLRVQYFEIVDGSSLRSLDNWSESDYIVGCITVFCGETPIRLIDNIQYKHP